MLCISAFSFVHLILCLQTLQDKKLKGQLAVREELYGKSAKAAAKIEKVILRCSSFPLVCLIRMIIVLPTQSRGKSAVNFWISCMRSYKK